jgi:putative selenate reductase
LIGNEIDKKEGFQDAYQILHLDALCNECGNCATFCPYDGKPYKDKLTLFATKEDFKNSTNNGFMVTDFKGSWLVTLRLQDKLWKLKLDKDKEFKKISVIISTVLKNYSYLIES